MMGKGRHKRHQREELDELRRKRGQVPQSCPPIPEALSGDTGQGGHLQCGASGRSLREVSKQKPIEVMG